MWWLRPRNHWWGRRPLAAEGLGGEYKEAETRFLRSRSHARSGHSLDQGRFDLRPRAVPAAVHVHFPGLITAGPGPGSAPSLREVSVAGCLPGSRSGRALEYCTFLGRRPRLTTRATPSRETHLPGLAATGEEQPRPGQHLARLPSTHPPRPRICQPRTCQPTRPLGRCGERPGKTRLRRRRSAPNRGDRGSRPRRHRVSTRPRKR